MMCRSCSTSSSIAATAEATVASLWVASLLNFLNPFPLFTGPTLSFIVKFHKLTVSSRRKCWIQLWICRFRQVWRRCVMNLRLECALLLSSLKLNLFCGLFNNSLLVLHDLFGVFIEFCTFVFKDGLWVRGDRSPVLRQLSTVLRNKWLKCALTYLLRFLGLEECLHGRRFGIRGQMVRFHAGDLSLG